VGFGGKISPVVCGKGGKVERGLHVALMATAPSKGLFVFKEFFI
jgi:hypothetical protein